MVQSVEQLCLRSGAIPNTRRTSLFWIYPEQMRASSFSSLMIISCSFPYRDLNWTANLRLMPILRMSRVFFHFWHEFLACTRESFSYISRISPNLKFEDYRYFFGGGGAGDSSCLTPPAWIRQWQELIILLIKQIKFPATGIDLLCSHFPDDTLMIANGTSEVRW